jgi:hypothetical protein
MSIFIQGCMRILWGQNFYTSHAIAPLKISLQNIFCEDTVAKSLYSIAPLFTQYSVINNWQNMRAI